MMFVRQRYAGALLAVIAVFGLAGCDGVPQAQDTPAPPQVSVMTLAGQELVISADLPARVAAVRRAARAGGTRPSSGVGADSD